MAGSKVCYSIIGQNGGQARVSGHFLKRRPKVSGLRPLLATGVSQILLQMQQGNGFAVQDVGQLPHQMLLPFTTGQMAAEVGQQREYAHGEKYHNRVLYTLIYQGKKYHKI